MRVRKDPARLWREAAIKYLKHKGFPAPGERVKG